MLLLFLLLCFRNVISEYGSFPLQNVGFDQTLGTRRMEMEEASMTAPEIIAKYDYPVETYSVTTEDKYVLQVHRIPFGIHSPEKANVIRPIVLCFHDIISSSSDFIINGPEKSLGYLLADAGYDVWLGNARGNRYSRKHKTMPPSNMRFWDFTFHEIGKYDIPAMIDFALNMTGQQKLHYVGFSQATTTYYVMMSERPIYNNKIKLAVHLSPVAYLTYMVSPIMRFFSMATNLIGLFLDVIGVGEFLPNYDIMRQFSGLVCKEMDFTQFLCKNILFLLSGFNEKNLNSTMFPIYAGHTPAGGSTKQFIHYGQLVQSGRFKYFDAGFLDNLSKYRTIRAPSYHLERASAPIVLVASNSDWYSMPADVNQLASELPNVVKRITVKDPDFAHIDFMFGINAKEQVYDEIIPLMAQY